MNEMMNRSVQSPNAGMIADVKYGSKSRNNQYEWLDGSEAPIVARYMKTVSYAVGGLRRNPNTNYEEGFILQTDESDFATGKWSDKGQEPSYWRFNYLNDVVELYSEFEHNAFKHRNKYLLENGLLVEYDGTEDGKVLSADIAEYNTNPFEEEVKAPEIVFGR